MANNNLLTFASADGALVTSDAAWASAAARLLGFQNGIADPALVSKGIRQGAFGAALLGQLIATYGLVDANDDGNVAGGLAKFRAGLAAMLAGVAYGQDTSTTANAIVVALDPAPPAALAAFRNLYVRVANTNTGPVTIALNALGSKPATRHNGTPLVAGDLPGGQITHFEYDPIVGQWVLGGLGAAEVPRIVSNYTLYVRTDGSDNGGGNDGSINDAAHAFATPAAAIYYGASRFSLAGGALTIKFGTPGTYAAPGIIPQTVGTLNIVGDANAPASYVLAGPNPAFVQGTVNISGVTLQNTSTSNSTVTASASGFVTLMNVNLTSTQTGLSHFGAGNGGIIAISQGVSVLSSMNNLFAAVTNGNIQINGNISLGASLTFSGGTALASTNATIGVAPGVVFTGSAASGPRYYVSLNGTISTNGGGANFFPGSTAGNQADASGVYG